MTIENTPENRLLSHSVLNYLNACYQGKFAFLNMLLQRKHPYAQNNFVEETKTTLAQIQKWQTAFHEGVMLLSTDWGGPESPEALKAFEIIDKTKHECIQLAEDIHSLTRQKGIQSRPLDISFLIAAYGRNAYMRDNYVRGNIEFATREAREDDLESFKHYLQETTDEIDLAHKLLKAANPQKTVDRVTFEVLISEALLLPGILRIQANDLALLHATYQEQFTFQMAGIPTGVAAEWKNLEVPAAEAADWYAHGFPAEEAIRWIHLSSPHIHSPTAAARWKLAGFHVDQVAEWLNINLPPLIARRWRKSGFTAEQTTERLKSGVLTPEAYVEKEQEKKEKPKEESKEIPNEEDNG